MDKTFYKADRDRAKAALSGKGDENALAYLEALEQIAEVAYALWVKIGTSRQKEMESDLYDALEVVDFMHDEEEER